MGLPSASADAQQWLSVTDNDLLLCNHQEVECIVLGHEVHASIHAVVQPRAMVLVSGTQYCSSHCVQVRTSNRDK